jgi:hydroxypyruvate isomerase
MTKHALKAHAVPIIRVVAPRFAVNVSILFGELPFLERFGAAAAAGLEAVEFWWPEEPLDAVVEAAR